MSTSQHPAGSDIIAQLTHHDGIARLGTVPLEQLWSALREAVDLCDAELTLRETMRAWTLGIDVKELYDLEFCGDLDADPPSDPT